MSKKPSPEMSLRKPGVQFSLQNTPPKHQNEKMIARKDTKDLESSQQATNPINQVSENHNPTIDRSNLTRLSKTSKQRRLAYNQCFCFGAKNLGIFEFLEAYFKHQMVFTGGHFILSALILLWFLSADVGHLIPITGGFTIILLISFITSLIAYSKAKKKERVKDEYKCGLFACFLSNFALFLIFIFIVGVFGIVLIPFLIRMAYSRQLRFDFYLGLMIFLFVYCLIWAIYVLNQFVIGFRACYHLGDLDKKHKGNQAVEGAAVGAGDEQIQVCGQEARQEGLDGAKQADLLSFGIGQ